MKAKSIKKQVQEELLARLDGIISSEVEVMSGHYTVAEIASEVILDIKNERKT